MSLSMFRRIGACLFALALMIQPCVAQECRELAGQSRLLGAADGPRHVAAAPVTKGLIAALTNDSRLVVYSQTAHGAPVEMNSLALDSEYGWMASLGKFAYVAGESGVRVFKIDKHGRITDKGQLPGSEAAGRIKADRNRLAVIHEGGWSLWDCEERSTPVLLARLAGDLVGYSPIALGSDRVVVDGLVYDISDPATPTELGNIPSVTECEIAGDRLYEFQQCTQSGGSWTFGDRWYYRTYGVKVRDLDAVDFPVLASYAFRYSTAYPPSAPRTVLARNGDFVLAGQTKDPNLLMIDTREPADAEPRWLPVAPSTALVRQSGQVVGLGAGVWAFRVPETTESGRVPMPSTDLGDSHMGGMYTSYTMIGADAAGDLVAAGVRVVESDGEWYWDDWTAVRIYQSQPGQLELVSTLHTWADRIVMIDGYLLLGGGGLRAVDLSDPAVPGEPVSVPDVGSRDEVTSLGGRMIATANSVGEFKVIDLADPAAPVLVGSCPLDGRSGPIAADGDRVLVALPGAAAIAVVDVSDPAAPRVERSIPVEGTVRMIAGRDGHGLAVVQLDWRKYQVDFDYTAQEPSGGLERRAAKQSASVRSMRIPMYVNGLTWHGHSVFMSGGGLHAYDPRRRDYIGSVATTHRYLGIVSAAERLYAVCADELVDLTDVACETASGGDSFRTADVETPRAGLAISAAPNPFNPQTVFSFSLEREQSVELAVFDVKGRRVRELARDTRTAGRHTFLWNGRDDRGRSLPSGIYFARLRAGGESEVARVTLLK